jgi:hypothetical protein
MTNIKEISPEASIGKVGRGQPAAAQAPEESRRGKVPAESSQRDILQVDEKRRDEVRLIENARLLLSELPDIRPERVEEVRRRLREGFYDRPDVIEKVVDQILKEGSFRASSARKAETGSEAKISEEEQKSEERVQRARRRQANGYYDQPDVLDETARRILKGNR